LGRRRTALAVHPPGVTVQVVLLFPDRHAVLDLIDDVAAGPEGLVAVRRAYSDPHRQLPDREVPEAVRAARVCDPEALHGLAEDALTFTQRECLEGLVLQVPDARALVVVAHPALERGKAPARGVGELAAQRLGVERDLTEAECGHGWALSRRPPAE